MNADGSGVRRLTRTPGYDGGPFFSDDGKKIVYRADHPTTPEDLARYRENLARHTYAPRSLEIRVMNADGSNDRAVTSNGAANFAPFFLPGRPRDHLLLEPLGPEGTRVRALPGPRGRDGADPGHPFSADFDGFPMFTRDGRRLVFASNRNGAKPRETNIFVADWVRK